MMLRCPICQRRRVRVNSLTYSFIRYRCDFCGTEWHSPKAFDEELLGCQYIAPKNASTVICEALTLRDMLQHWGGKIMEFLDGFAGSFEDDEFAQEGLALQNEGRKLGLVRDFPAKKEKEA
jgi:hypothetical protein